jgi:hypothetical protein
MAGRISYYGNIVKDGLVLDLDAAKQDSYPGVGTSWNDISGFQNNGVLTNGPTFNKDKGGSIVFDGVDDLVTLPTIAFGVNQFTIDLWFKLNGNQTLNASLIGVAAAAAINNWQLSCYNNNINMQFFYKGADGTNDSILLNYTFVSQVWANVTITKNSNNDIITYVNGSQTNSKNYATNYNHTEPLRIGLNRGGTAYYKGDISICRLYNGKGLSASEVLQNYNATKGRYL